MSASRFAWRALLPDREELIVVGNFYGGLLFIGVSEFAWRYISFSLGLPAAAFVLLWRWWPRGAAVLQGAWAVYLLALLLSQPNYWRNQVVVLVVFLAVVFLLKLGDLGVRWLSRRFP